MDWRLLTLITVLAWGGYNVALKFAAGRLAWQVSMFLFVLSYAIIVGAYCLMQADLSRASLWQRAAWWPLLAGLLCGIGGITFFKALPSAPGSLFLPLVGLYSLVSAVGCIVLLHEPFTLRIAAGILCATAAVVLLAR